MGKKKNMNEAVDRNMWKSSLELMEEFGYTDRGSVSNILSANKVSKVKNPESRLPQSFLWNRNEFMSTSVITSRLLDNQEMERYDKELRLYGDFILSGDDHVPFHDMELIDASFNIARKFGIRKIIKAGDFLELDAFKTYLDKGASWEYEKRKARNVINATLTQFDEMDWLIGNHEMRLWKRLQGMGDEEDIFQLVLEKEHIEKVRYSIYPYCIINDSWMIVHPKSYSRIQTRNAYFLASKHLIKLIEEGKSPNGNYGIVAYHGHLGGMGTDISGRFEVADGMGMMDPDKIHYQKIKISTAPEWRPGFHMLLDNCLYAFPKRGTNWDFWTKRIKYS